MRELFNLVGAGAVIGVMVVLVLRRIGILERIDVRVMLAGIVIGFLLTSAGW